MDTKSVTLSISIACTAKKAYGFIADATTMPRWAVHNVKAIRPLGDNEWEIQTPRGAGRLRTHFEPASGILDHDFIDAQEGTWHVSARIVQASPQDSVYMITLVKPPSMLDERFTEGIPLVEEELQVMKRILEATKEYQDNSRV